jgi:hypothetical protein
MNRFQGIDSASLCSRGGRTYTSKRVVVLACQAGNRFLRSLKGLQIRALYLLRHANSSFSRGLAKKLGTL